MKQLALLSLAFVWLTPTVYAWNSLGHKVVAEIAWQQLNPKQRQECAELVLQQLLQSHFKAAANDSDTAAEHFTNVVCSRNDATIIRRYDRE